MGSHYYYSIPFNVSAHDEVKAQKRFPPDLPEICEGKPPVDSSHKEPVIWGIDITFVVCLNKMLNKELNCLWFGTP